MAQIRPQHLSPTLQRSLPWSRSSDVRFDRCRGRLRPVVTHDESGTSLAAEIRPNPLQEDTQTEARCRQKLEVDKRPGKPGSETAYLHLATLQYSEALS